MFRRLALLLGAAALLGGCASSPRPLPPYEKPLARTEYQHVRTTAYFDGEADHLKYTNHNALGTCLQHGHINSAAADWSRWPAGTMFTILQTGETYVVDDYGWDLAGTNTIDLYKPTRAAMDRWGVHHVDIHVTQWGDPRLSYDTLEPRSGYRHVALMLKELRPELNTTPPTESYPIPPSAIPVAAAPVSEPAVARTTSLDNAPPLRSFNSTW